MVVLLATEGSGALGIGLPWLSCLAWGAPRCTFLRGPCLLGMARVEIERLVGPRGRFFQGDLVTRGALVLWGGRLGRH